MTIVCSKCGERPRRPKHKYCAPCHAVYMREWRKTHPLTGDARKRQITRAYAREYRVRGYLTPKPCERCGNPKPEMHHTDYGKPLEVTWLCRRCHLAEHGKQPSDRSAA